MSTSDTTVAVVGLDSPFWPTAFADTLADVPGADVIGFTDLGVAADAVAANVGATPAEYADAHGLRDLGDLEAALDAADAVTVSTRHTQMPGVIADALDAGCHVFAAKPVAIDAAGLREIDAAVADTDAVFTAGQAGRSDPAVRAVRDVVDGGEVGEVRSVRVMHQHGRTHEWTAGTWYTERDEGGPTHWLGWYPVDVASTLLGPVTEVWGHAQRLVDADDDQPEHLKAVAGHGGDTLSTLEVHADIDTDWNVGAIELEVVGSDGVVRYAAPDESVAVHTDDGVDNRPFEPGNALATDLEQWVAACRGEGEPTLSAVEALRVAAGGCAWHEASLAADRHAEVPDV